jgi:hypothetical protein
MTLKGEWIERTREAGGYETSEFGGITAMASVPQPFHFDIHITKSFAFN